MFLERLFFLTANPFLGGDEHGEIPDQCLLYSAYNDANLLRSLESCCITVRQEFWVSPKTPVVARGKKR